MSRESVIQSAIRILLGRLGMLFLRYQVGLFYTKDGRPVKIGEVGVSDLIGAIPHTITESDVGKTIAVFTVFETKQVKDSTDAQRRASQGNFLRAVNRMGGIGAIVKSEADVEDVVEKKWESPLVRKFSVDG